MNRSGLDTWLACLSRGLGSLALVSLYSISVGAEPIQDVRLTVAEALPIEGLGSLVVTLYHAKSWTQRHRLSDGGVEAWLSGPDQQDLLLGRGRTDARGHVVLAFSVPSWPAGTYDLRIRASSSLGTVTTRRTVRLVHAVRVVVRTDGFAYQPGESVRWRISVTDRVNGRPRELSGTISILDPVGRTACEAPFRTDELGMTNGACELDSGAPVGLWQLLLRFDGRLATTRFHTAPSGAVPLPRSIEGGRREGATQGAHRARWGQGAIPDRKTSEPAVLRLHARTSPAADGGPARVRFDGQGMEEPVVVSLMSGDFTVAMAVTDATSGEFQSSIRVPAGSRGLLAVRADQAEFDPGSGHLAIASAHATVDIGSRRLAVTTDVSRGAAHGEMDALRVRVTDHLGRPVEGAGVAVEVADIRRIRGAVPRIVSWRGKLAEFDGVAWDVALPELLLDVNPSPPFSSRSRELAEPGCEPRQTDTVVIRWREEQARLANVGRRATDLLARSTKPLVRWTGGRWQWTITLDETLRQLGWARERRADPWGQPTTWAGVAVFVPEFERADLLQAVAAQRLAGLAAEVDFRKDPGASVGVVDPWGYRIGVMRDAQERPVLVAPGPDGRRGTSDDIRLLAEREPEDGLVGRCCTDVIITDGTSEEWSSPAGVLSVPGDEGIVFNETVLWTTMGRTDSEGRTRLPLAIESDQAPYRILVEVLGVDGATGVDAMLVHRVGGGGLRVLRPIASNVDPN